MKLFSVNIYFSGALIESIHLSDEGIVTKSAKGKSDLKSKCMAVKGLDPKLVETILNEVVPNSSTGVKFSDVSGQEKVIENKNAPSTYCIH